jgi:hypothetical protein
VASGRFRLLLVPWSGERRKKDRRGGRRRAGRRLRSEKRAENDDGGGEARAKEEEGRRERESQIMGQGKREKLRLRFLAGLGGVRRCVEWWANETARSFDSVLLFFFFFFLAAAS